MQKGCPPTVSKILSGRPDQAENPLFCNAATWLEAQLGEVSKAKQSFKKKERFLANKALRRCRVGELVKCDRQRVTNRAATRLFTVVKNEAHRIPWFLNYYRNLGVEYFFFVDNGSTDHTREILLNQSDAHVFFTDTAYSEGASGMVWTNHLMEEFGRRGWNIYVDVDEALVFPECESSGLEPLIQHMERQNHEALPAFMLDMFSKTNGPDKFSAEPFAEFLSAYPCYVSRFNVARNFQAPYFSVYGGARAEKFNDRANQTKTPLVRGGRGIKFLGSSHAISPAVISDVSSALLHFRLTNQFLSEVKSDLQSNQRSWFCQQRMASYVVQERSAQQNDLRDSHERVYRTSHSLLADGLISAPAHYRGQ